MFVISHLLVNESEMNVDCDAVWGLQINVAVIGSSLGHTFPFMTKSIIFLSIMVKSQRKTMIPRFKLLIA